MTDNNALITEKDTVLVTFTDTDQVTYYLDNEVIATETIQEFTYFNDDIGPPGRDGEQGPAGVGVPAGGLTDQVLKKSSNADYDTEWSTSTDSTYIYTQMSPATTWNITHGLNKFPSVTVVDSAGTVVIGQVDYISNNEITLQFSAGFSGYAYLN